MNPFSSPLNVRKHNEIQLYHTIAGLHYYNSINENFLPSRIHSSLLPCNRLLRHSNYEELQSILEGMKNKINYYEIEINHQDTGCISYIQQYTNSISLDFNFIPICNIPRLCSYPERFKNTIFEIPKLGFSIDVVYYF